MRDGIGCKGLVRRRLDLLYRRDADGRMLATNESFGAGEEAPMAHVCMSPEVVVFAVRSGLPSAVEERLSGILAALEELSGPEDRSMGDRIWGLVCGVPGVRSIEVGPVYRFPARCALSPEVVLIDQNNPGVLPDELAAMAEGLPLVQPCFGRLVRGRAVSICQTVRSNLTDREAGVETLPSHRRRGYGSEVVAEWGQEIQRRGLTPTYSTDWDNHGSVGIAGRLGLIQFAVEINVE